MKDLSFCLLVIKCSEYLFRGGAICAQRQEGQQVPSEHISPHTLYMFKKFFVVDFLKAIFNFFFFFVKDHF